MKSNYLFRECKHTLFKFLFMMLSVVTHVSSHAIIFDFESSLSGSGSRVVGQTVSEKTITLRSTRQDLVIGNSNNYGMGPWSSGKFVYTNDSGSCETQISVALINYENFKLNSIKLRDAYGFNPSIYLTSNLNQSDNINLSNSQTIYPSFSNSTISSFTITGSDPSCTANGFAVDIDNIDITVAPGTPTIGTATAGSALASVSFTAPDSNGGAAITGYTVTSSPGGITSTGSSSPITVTGLTNGTAYTFTVTATNSTGTGSASASSNSVTPKASQTITFNNPSARSFGTTPTLPASASSSLAVTFTSSTTGVCTVTSGGALTFITAGTCTINTDQAGNGTYLAATTVSQSFSVNAVVPGAPTIGTATAGSAQASVSFTAPASNGGAAITGYTVTSSPGGITSTGSSSPITVTGLTNGTAYTFTVTATNSAGPGSASAASNSVTPKASQTITFSQPGAQSFGTTPTLSASASSSLSVSFTSSTTGVCTVTSGGALTFITTGTCTINTDQAGDGTYLAATTFSRSFSVNAVVPGAPTIGTATAGSAQASVSFTAPASNGGAAITGYTVTSNPGGITSTGATSPIVVSGLTNGTAYTFTVTATNSAGTGSASATSNSVSPQLAGVCGSANGVLSAFIPTRNLCTSGTATSVSVTSHNWSWSCNSSSGNATCSAPQQSTSTSTGIGSVSVAGSNGWAVDPAHSAGFIPLTGHAKSPNVAPPAGLTFPQGLLDFQLDSGTAGSTASITITYPTALPSGSSYWKFGPEPTNTTPHWYQFPGAVISGDRMSITLSIQDGGQGDSDLNIPGSIADPGGPAFTSVDSAAAIPTLSEWAMMGLAGLLGIVAMREQRRRRLIGLHSNIN